MQNKPYGSSREGAGHAFPGLTIRSLTNHWVAETSACRDPAEGPPEEHYDERRPEFTVILDRAGVMLHHQLRSSSIAHYFYETFHAFYAHFDGVFGDPTTRRQPFKWLAEEIQNSGRPLTILIDSVVDPVKTSGNEKHWFNDWGEGRMRQDGLPNPDSVNCTESPSFYVSNANSQVTPLLLQVSNVPSSCSSRCLGCLADVNSNRRELELVLGSGSFLLHCWAPCQRKRAGQVCDRGTELGRGIPHGSISDRRVGPHEPRGQQRLERHNPPPHICRSGAPRYATYVPEPSESVAHLHRCPYYEDG